MEDPRTLQFKRHMRGGEFELAWRVSDAILREQAGKPDHGLPRHFQSIWTGRPVSGKRVLIRCYHGLGDTIQFIRYAPLLRAAAAEVTLWAQPSLLTLLKGVDGVHRILPLHDGTPDWHGDVDIEVMELPYLFRTTLETIPSGVPYIHVDAVPAAHDGTAVGVVWRAGDWDPRRDVPFGLMTELARIPEVKFYSLQMSPGAAEHDDRFEPVVSAETDALTTATIMRGLDLVISVDSMPAHLAGALGIPVWTLLHADADWRWMENRQDSPWYPTMRLFRQEKPGEWETVIARVTTELARFSRSLERSHPVSNGRGGS